MAGRFKLRAVPEDQVVQGLFQEEDEHPWELVMSVGLIQDGTQVEVSWRGDLGGDRKWHSRTVPLGEVLWGIGLISRAGGRALADALADLWERGEGVFAEPAPAGEWSKAGRTGRVRAKWARPLPHRVPQTEEEGEAKPLSDAAKEAGLTILGRGGRSVPEGDFSRKRHPTYPLTKGDPSEHHPDHGYTGPRIVPKEED